MDVLLYTAGEFQAGIAIVAVAVAVSVWFVCRVGYGRQLRDARSRFGRYREQSRKRIADLKNENDTLLRTIDENSTQFLKQGEELFQANQTANEYKHKFAGEKSGHDRLKKAYDKVLAEVTRMTNDLKGVNADLAEGLAEKAELENKLTDLKKVLTDSGISKTGVRHKLTAQIVKYGKKFGVRLARKEGKLTVTEWESAGLMVTESAARMKIKKLETAVIRIEPGE